MTHHFKQLKTNLQNQHGYSHQWKLIKEKEISVSNKKRDKFYIDFFDKITKQTTKSLCQNIDLIVPSKIRTQSQQIQLEQFLNIIGTELHAHELKRTDSVDRNQRHQDATIREFERNDEKRQFRIQEFIKTEKSYVDTLKTIVKYVVYPLRANTQQHQKPILNTFKCQKIFLNIDQIMSVNEKFLADLLLLVHDDFGSICEKHIINFECYRKYLLEQSEAQKLHAKEFKMNQTYRRFLVKVKDQSEFKRKRLQDILVEPVQRISRYAMMLRDILQLTPQDHPDYCGLKAACEKTQEIATMADDDPTKNATMFLNLYQGIKDSPCSLINQKRSLVAHLDATEIHCVTNKPTRSVSLFLFTDKILVASRDSTKEIDLDDLLDNSNTSSPIISSNSIFPNKKLEKSQYYGLKFKGWADIESIELFDGGTSDSFILSATNVQETKRNEMSNITSFEKYFYKGPRLFSILPTGSLTKLKKQHYLDKTQEFTSLYQKTRALGKQYESTDKTFYKVWKGVPTFCSVYSQENYMKSKYKNDSALLYVDDNSMDTEKLFGSRVSSLFNPWIIGLIQPEDMKGFRFNICTRTLFPTYPTTKATTNTTTIDFESIFWNNLFYLNSQLKKSLEYTTHTMIKIQQAIHGGGNHGSIRSRSKSMSRTSSIPSIGKLFSSNHSISDDHSPRTTSNHSRSRSVSPSIKIKTSKSPCPSPSAHHSWSGSAPIIQYSDSSHRSSVTTLSSSSLWSSSSSTSPSPPPADRIDMQPSAIGTISRRKSLQQHQTISSIGSSTRSSSGSMTEDEDNDDDDDLEDNIDYLTIKTTYCRDSTTPEYKSFCSIMTDAGFEDEMQQQWKALITKYELLQVEK